MRRFAAALLLPSFALAAESDFGPDEAGWNGLSELCELARGMGMTVDVTDDVDLDQRSVSATTVVLISPNTAPDADVLVRFLRRGGRVLIADDYGDSDPLLSALGIERVMVPTSPPDELYRDNPHLPVSRPASPGPLAQGVEEVVTNHPAYLRSRLPAVLGFSSSLDAIAVAGEVDGGREPGRFAALSDPSVLINNMLTFAGNVAFARNLLEWLGRPGGRIVFLRHDFVVRGGPETRERFRLTQLRREFNAFVAGLSKTPPSRAHLRALALLVALGMGCALVAILRLPRRPPTGPFAVKD